jgi:hypothetical protein
MRCRTFQEECRIALGKGRSPVASPNPAKRMHPDQASRRRYRVCFRVTALERQALDAAALKCGLKLSGYARATLVGAKPTRAVRRPAVEAVLLARVLAKLGMIASSLGDIAIH